MGYIVIILLIIIFFPPLLDGLGRRIRARIQYRVGPPLLQSCYDLIKLLGMDYNVPTKSLLFVVAPFMYLASLLLAALILPFGATTLIGFHGDFFVFLYVIAMASVALMLCGFCVNNTYANIGANREMMLILSIHPVLGIAIGIFALNAGSLALGHIPYHLEINFTIIVAYVLLAYSVYVESAFVPFDVAEAEIEIQEGPLIEYSGRLFGILKYSLMLKRTLMIWLLSTFIVIPILVTLHGPDISEHLILLLQVLLTIVLYAGATAIGALNARLRIGQIVKQNYAIFAGGVVMLIIAWVGW